MLASCNATAHMLVSLSQGPTHSPTVLFSIQGNKILYDNIHVMVTQ